MATTIGNYKVSLGLNVADLVDGSKLARNETAAVVRSLRSLVTPTEHVERQLNLLEKAYKEGAIEERIYQEATRRLTDSVRDNTVALNANAEAIRRDNQLIAEGERLTKSLMTVEERHAQELRRLKNLRDQGAIGEMTYHRALAASNAKLADSRIITAQVVRTPPILRNPLGATQAVAATSGAAALSSRLSNLAAGYIGVYTAANFASGAIRRAADLERAIVSYESLTGSVEQAQDILQGVRDLASKGIDPTSLHQSAQMMLSFNVAASDIVPSLQQIGAITGGDTMRMERLSLAFAQVASNGRLMGEEVNQMVEAGFNPLQEISRTTGVSVADLRKQMADGLISFEMVKNAFASATSEGGRFHGRLDDITDTLSGTINMAKATYAAFQESFGQEIAPAVKIIATDFKDAASSGGELLGIAREMTQAFTELNSTVEGISGKGLFGTMTSGLGFANTLGSQVRTTVFKDALFGVGGSLLTGDLAGAVKATQDVLTPFEKIDEFLDKQHAQQQQAERTAAMAAKASEAPAKAAEAIVAELSPEKVTIAYNRLQDAIKGAQAAAVPTLTNLQKQVAEKQRIVEATKEIEHLEREADRIREGAITPAEKLAQSVAEIGRMQQLGMLTEFEANRAKQEMLNSSVKDLKLQMPQNLEVGSQEAYKFFAQQSNREQEKAMRAEAKAQSEKEIAAINGVKTSVDTLANSIKRKR